MIIAFLAAALLAPGSPDTQLASLQNTSAFHIYVMPDSAKLEQVTVLAKDAQGKPTALRLVYRMSEQTLTVEESAQTGNGASVQSFGPDALFVNGFPATYTRTGPYYRQEGHLTWAADGVNVMLSSPDLIDVPALVNAALSLR